MPRPAPATAKAARGNRVLLSPDVAVSKRVASALRRAVERFPTRSKLSHFEVTPGIDHSGLPALFITVRLRPIGAPPTVANLNRMASILHDELVNGGVPEWPYVTFDWDEDE